MSKTKNFKELQKKMPAKSRARSQKKAAKYNKEIDSSTVTGITHWKAEEKDGKIIAEPVTDSKNNVFKEITDAAKGLTEDIVSAKDALDTLAKEEPKWYTKRMRMHIEEIPPSELTFKEILQKCSESISTTFDEMNDRRTVGVSIIVTHERWDGSYHSHVVHGKDGVLKIIQHQLQAAVDQLGNLTMEKIYGVPKKKEEPTNENH